MWPPKKNSKSLHVAPKCFFLGKKKILKRVMTFTILQTKGTSFKVQPSSYSKSIMHWLDTPMETVLCHNEGSIRSAVPSILCVAPRCSRGSHVPLESEENQFHPVLALQGRVLPMLYNCTVAKHSIIAPYLRTVEMHCTSALQHCTLLLQYVAMHSDSLL